MSEARQLLALAIPVILAQIAQTAMGFVDTVMAGGYSATDMAAVAIGTSIWLPAILFGHGLLLALTPVIAQLNGSGRRDRIAHQVRQGFWLAGFVSILIMFVLWNAGYIIHAMHNIDPALADKAVGYLRALLWGAPGYLFFQVGRNQCEGLAKTKPGMVMGFIGLLVNIPVNYIFIYGHFGMPELGGVGCGVATAAVYWVMFFSMISYVKRARSMRDIRHEELSKLDESGIVYIGAEVTFGWARYQRDHWMPMQPTSIEAINVAHSIFSPAVIITILDPCPMAPSKAHQASARWGTLNTIAKPTAGIAASSMSCANASINSITPIREAPIRSWPSRRQYRWRA
jgi:peptidoglycan biosynthesis protein MviN/MurJ (putative lipid II flippase)